MRTYSEEEMQLMRTAISNILFEKFLGVIEGGTCYEGALKIVDELCANTFDSEDISVSVQSAMEEGLNFVVAPQFLEVATESVIRDVIKPLKEERFAFSN